MVGCRSAAWVLAAGLAMVCGCAHPEPAADPLRGADVIELGERTSNLTGAPLPRRLGTEVVDRDAVIEVLKRHARREWKKGEARRYAEGLTAMGLWPRDVDLLASLVQINVDQLGGFYLPDEHTIYVVDDAAGSVPLLGATSSNRDLGREFLLAHELIHAHQHSTHPELLEFFMRWHSQDDAANATAAAVEGHALRAAMQLYVEAHELPTPEVVAKYFGAEPNGSPSRDARPDPAHARLPLCARLPLGLSRGARSVGSRARLHRAGDAQGEAGRGLLGHGSRAARRPAAGALRQRLPEHAGRAGDLGALRRAGGGARRRDLDGLGWRPLPGGALRRTTRLAVGDVLGIRPKTPRSSSAPTPRSLTRWHRAPATGRRPGPQSRGARWWWRVPIWRRLCPG